MKTERRENEQKGRTQVNTESNARAQAEVAVAEREKEILRAIEAAGWLWTAARVALDEDGFVSSITAFCPGPAPRRPGVESFIYLHVSLWRGDVMGIEAEYPGHGVRVFIGNGKIPTPDEAYHAELRRSSG